MLASIDPLYLGVHGGENNKFTPVARLADPRGGCQELCRGSHPLGLHAAIFAEVRSAHLMTLHASPPSAVGGQYSSSGDVPGSGGSTLASSVPKPTTTAIGHT